VLLFVMLCSFVSNALKRRPVPTVLAGRLLPKDYCAVQQTSYLEG
jgi:hypothetical protein